MSLEKAYIHGFKVHTSGLLTEIADAGLYRGMGVLYHPMNIFRRYLISIAERASELNDPILNKIMADMTLYEAVDPKSKDYDDKVIKKINKEYIDYLNLNK